MLIEIRKSHFLSPVTRRSQSVIPFCVYKKLFIRKEGEGVSRCAAYLESLVSSSGELSWVVACKSAEDRTPSQRHLRAKVSKRFKRVKPIVFAMRLMLILT